MVDADSAAFLDSLTARVERELSQRYIDAGPDERAALLDEYRRRAEDYTTLSLMRRVPARLARSAESMREATGLTEHEVAFRLLRALAASHRRVIAALGGAGPAARDGYSGQ